jgi:polyisoprenoid-binding protein YceI
MTQNAPTRILDGVVLPAPGIWKIDPSHAEVAFVGRHFMLTKVRGRFTKVDGEVHIADRPEDSSVSVKIEMASVYSGFEMRDDHLRSPNFFDVERYPWATFTSTDISWAGSGGQMTGDLTINDVTRPITLEISYLGHARDPRGNDRAGFEAHAHINRENWGITWNQLLESGGMMISKEIDLEVNLEITRAT